MLNMVLDKHEQNIINVMHIQLIKANPSEN